jgi:hypothetical protein
MGYTESVAKGETMTTATSTAPAGGYFKEKYPNGYTLSKSEQNFVDDSYFYETVWLADLKKVETFSTGSTAYSLGNGDVVGHSGLPTIFEAPAEVQAEFRAYAKQIALDTRKRWAEGVANAYIESFVGAEIRVIHPFKNDGVKYEVGTKGKVFWYGAGYFKHSTRRIGFKLADGTKVFTNEDNVEKLSTLAIDEQAVNKWVNSIDEYLDNTDIKNLIGYVTGLPHTAKDFQERKVQGEQFVLRVFG